MDTIFENIFENNKCAQKRDFFYIFNDTLYEFNGKYLMIKRRVSKNRWFKYVLLSS